MAAISESVLLRLVLAKSFLLRAQAELKRRNDDLALASAAVSLHDAVDNLLGAVVTHMNYRYPDPRRAYLLNSFQLIEDKGNTLTGRTEIEQLNQIRNDIKHVGLLPNPQAISALGVMITRFADQVSSQFFGKNLTEFSLSERVDDTRQRHSINEIQTHIDRREYREAMEKSAITLFKYYQSRFISMSKLSRAIMGDPLDSCKNVFPQEDSNQLSIQLLKIEIDPYLYHRFSNLVPKAGYGNLRDENIILKKDALFWHERNWTRENAHFCLGFVTNVLIRLQRGYAGYTIVERFVEQKIKFLVDSAIYSDEHCEEIKQQFAAGEEIECLANFVDGEWQPKEGAEPTDTAEIIYGISHSTLTANGYIKKRDVQVSEANEYIVHTEF